MGVVVGGGGQRYGGSLTLSASVSMVSVTAAWW